MVWVIAGSWAFALVVGVVVLGYCGYELAWKSARLQRDLRRLQSLQADLLDTSAQLAAAGRRATQLRDR